MSSNFTGNPSGLIPETYIIPEDVGQKDLKIRQYLNLIAAATNTKDSGIYDGLETITGQQFLPTFSTQTTSNATAREVIRKVIDFGALPNAALKSVAHGIPIGVAANVDFSVTKMYAAATNPGVSWIPLPYASPTLANNIELNFDATNINITTGIDRTAYTRCFVIVEYMTTI